MDTTNLIQYRDKIVGIIIIIIAILVAQNIYKGQNKIVQALVEEKNMQIKKNEMLSKIQEDENTIKDYKEVINNKDVSLLINNINNFAKEENVKIISIEPGAQKIGQAYYDTYPFEFNVIAKNYHDLGKFIARLESSNDIYMMSRVNINKINDVEGKISVALSVDTIMIKEGNE